MKAALKEAERTGREDARLATNLYNLGIVYGEQPLPAEAEPLLRRVLTIYEKTPPPGHSDIAASLHSPGGA